MKQGRVTEFCQENTLVIANTLFQQHKRRLHTLPDGQYQNQIDYIYYSLLWSSKTRPGADCGSDHKPCIAKFRFNLKKVGKTNSPLRYCLNQISYNYTMEVMNRFTRLDLVDRMPEELWTEVHDIAQEAVTEIIPKKKKCKKAKWLSEEVLQVDEKEEK